jgi:hypothetical protein
LPHILAEMDDYSIASLYDSKSEWACRMVNILTPMVQEGFKSIFDEAMKLCNTNKEGDKYLMTFQNFLSRVPKWNATIIQQETTRIKERCTCGYLEDLITCVHIIHLKCMTAMRVGNKQKKIDIKIPDLPEFIHKVYVNCARKLYSNVYIFEKGIHPLNIQRHNREFEIIVKECIFNTIRDNIPVEELIKLYLEDVIEDVVEVTENEEVINQEPIVSESSANLSARRRTHHSTRRRRHRDRMNDGMDGDSADDGNVNSNDGGAGESIDQLDFVGELNGSSEAPNTERISSSAGVSFGNNDVRTFETDASERINEYNNHGDGDGDDEDNSGDRLHIGGDIHLDTMDIHSLNDSQNINAPPLLDDIEIL